MRLLAGKEPGFTALFYLFCVETWLPGDSSYAEQIHDDDHDDDNDDGHHDMFGWMDRWNKQQTGRKWGCIIMVTTVSTMLIIITIITIFILILFLW